LRKSRIHPIAVLAALNTYAGGHGFRGTGTWKPVQKVVDALDRAFYDSFANVEPTGKRLVLGLDVSGSMVGTLVAGVAGLDCRKACGAMALVTSAKEDAVTYLAFDTKVYELDLKKANRLDDVVGLLARTGGGGTDCAAPIQHAIRKKIVVDAFVIYTDSETWYGSQHPAQAMAEYRKKLNPKAKLVVVAMASTRTSIADPGDALTLNVVGFDASVPSLIAQFLGD
jgi:60 kDa SS-A/Ro ribonucleoprotein